MTLCLLGPLRWEAAEAAPRPLPVVLPAALLLVLARHGEWVSRAELAALFWPDQADEAALLNLRVTLHKARRLLENMGIGEPMQAERRRIRWSPPTDLGRTGQGHGPPALGFDLPQFERFDRWLRDWRHGCSGPSPHTATLGSTDLDDDEASPPPAASGFYGRRVELARLRAADLPALVVAGEAGVGKSRLVA
ncbi:MAG: hypothetical protein IH627_00850, partial [Rubrivivax sp.]|nr:hypothetical protein [Rubrivivax sp.]